MENKYTGEGYLKAPLTEMGKRLSEDDKAYPFYKILQFNVNELSELIETFKEKLKEGCMLLLDGKIYWANKAATDISGYESEVLTGLNIVELTVPDMREKLAARMKMLEVEGSLPSPEEWPLLRADRTVAFVNVFAYSVKFLNNLAVLMFFWDITAEKKTMEEQKMRAEMMDSINDGVFLMELSGNIVYANEAFCLIAGYSREEVLKMNILDVTAPEVRKRYDIRVKQFSIHKEARFTTVALSRDGKRIPVEIRGKIIMHGNKQRVLGVARAIRADSEPDIESIDFSN